MAITVSLAQGCGNSDNGSMLKTGIAICRYLCR